MSYYGVGDYYGSGDPGFFSALGGFLKGAARGAVGFATGGPTGALAAVVPRIVGTTSGPGGISVPRIASPGPTVGSLIPATLPLLIPPQGINLGGVMAGTVPRGYHPNKSGYFLKSGEYIAPGTRNVRNRSRNFANGRALNRAISRTSGFNRLVKRSRKNLRALSKI